MNWYYIEYERYNTAYQGAVWEGADKMYKSSGSVNKQLPDDYKLNDLVKEMEEAERNIQIKYVIKSINKL